MNKIKSLILALLFVALPAFGQTALTSTTLNEVVNNSETRIDVVSDSSAVAGDIAFVDREAMLVISVDATNNRLRVQRGFAGTLADDHASGAVIFLDRPGRFIGKDLAGACTAGSEFPNFSPLINLSSGRRFACVNSIWSEVGWQPSGVIQSMETSTAVDVLVSSQCGETIFLDNATGYLTTLPVPSAGCFFRFVLVTLLTSGNHTLATNASANILIGGINELEVDTTNDGPYSSVGDLITFVGTLEALGDYVEMISDGTSWYLNGQTNLDGGITIGST